MDAEELIAKARDQRKRGRFEEAAISARAATVQDPDNADGWWQLALNSYSLGNMEAALAAVNETNDRAPHFAQAWSRRGLWELETGDVEEAGSSFEVALDCDEDDSEALRGLAQIYGKLDANTSEKRAEEIRVLTKLDQIEGLSSWSVNRLGILHFLNRHGFEAIKYWSRNALSGEDTASMFNLGLAYNMNDVSQDVDAVDCWRMVLQMDASHEKAPIKIQAVMPRLLELARTLRSSRESLCLPEDQWYTVYLNPFQLLNCPMDFDLIDLDDKTVQKWKKTLLQEIELEEGKLDWMPGLIVDRSKAIELSNQLSNVDIALFHWQVYQCQPLLKFLSKGDIEHFLLKNWSPLDLIEFVGESEEFRKWLSEPFSIQYDRIFTKAIAVRDVPTIEALLDGRRWVLPSYADRCFENALREADSILTPLRELELRAKDIKISTKDVQTVLDQNKIASILNFLPPYFRELQNEAVTLVRSIAIDAHNIYDDTDLSLAILETSKRFSFKSVELAERLKEDYDTVAEMIRKQREFESELHFGKDRVWKITKEGIWDNTEFCPAEAIRSLRWGILIQENRAQNYFFAARRSTGKEYVVTWTSSDNKKQEELFEGLINAAFHYLIPCLIENLSNELGRGNTLVVGPIQVTKYGLSFETKGLLLTKRIQVPWRGADITISNGSTIVTDKYTGKKSTPIALRDVANAPLLHLLQITFNQK